MGNDKQNKKAVIYKIANLPSLPQQHLIIIIIIIGLVPLVAFILFRNRNEKELVCNQLKLRKLIVNFKIALHYNKDSLLKINQFLSKYKEHNAVPNAIERVE